MNKKMDNKVFPLEVTNTTTTTVAKPKRERLIALACLSFFPLIYFIGKFVSSML